MQPLQGGGQVKIIAGTANIDEQLIQGPIQGISTEPLFLDVQLPAAGYFVQPLPPEHNALIYLYEGQLEITSLAEIQTLQPHSAGILSAGDRLEVYAGQTGAAFLVLAAHPIGEPIVQYGPFVMNTREQIEQAIADYQNGQLTKSE